MFRGMRAKCLLFEDRLMEPSENWYRSARRDRLRAAALVGTVAVGYWGYKRLRKAWSSDDGDSLTLGLLAVVGLAIAS